VRRGDQAGEHRRGAALQLFSKTDMDDIHLATLQVLDHSGVQVISDEACDVFADGGCRVDRETNTVRISPSVVEDALRSAPTSFRIFGRDKSKDLIIEPGRVTFSPFGVGIMINDLQTGEHRETRAQDVADIALLTDYLNELAINTCAVEPRDKAPETAALHALEAVLNNTTKPFACGGLAGRRQTEIAVEIATCVAGGAREFRERPPIVCSGCSIAPLVLPSELTDTLLVACAHGIPWIGLSMGMAGGSTPITLAGTTVIQNAEQLATLVMTQLVNRGNAFWYGTSTCTMDMRWGASAVGTPETALYSASAGAMGGYYGIPSWTAGY
jgi:trimethylamine---corrinoid protein Co-methyltransferase